jgi:hypothetical protein
MINIFYKSISTVAKLLFKDKISGKYFFGSKKMLYYPSAQHLGFLFQSEIRYEFEIFNAIKPYIQSRGIVFDIGANIGQYAIPISELIGHQGRVYSFEPDPKNFAFLQFNTAIIMLKI